MQFTLAVIPFVTPWLFAAGAAATSVPIVIHLLNRRKFRIHRWAAMEFLLAAMRRNARRLKFQRWLLLLLRCLALLLLAAAIAQLTFNSSLLAHVLGASGRSTVVVWDDAYPMGYQPRQDGSNFHRSRQVLLTWLKGLSGDERVAIVPASVQGRPLVSKPTLDRALLMRLVQEQKLSDAAVDLSAGLEQALQAVKAVSHRTNSTRVILLSDCAAADFYRSAPGRAPEINHRLAHLVQQLRSAGAHVRVADVGRPGQSNTAIVSLKTTRPVTLVNKPIRVTCTLYNSGPQAQEQIPVQFYLDNVRAGKEVISRLGSGRRRSFTFTLTGLISAPGAHLITAQMPPDMLPVDNTRHLMVKAVNHVPVLLVDGAPAEPSLEKLGSTAWLAAALAPDGQESFFSPQVIGELELSTTSLRRYRVVVLSDTAAPDRATAKRLAAWVRAGGLLMIFPGPRTESRRWDAALGASPAGLLPASLGQAMGRRRGAIAGGKTGAVNFSLAQSLNAITAPFVAAQQSGLHVGLASVRTRRYIALTLLKGVGARVLLQFTSGKPALMLRRKGHGAVVLWATTADTRWTDFPAEPSWLPFNYELLFHTLPRHDVSRNLLVGRKFDLTVKPGYAGAWFGPDKTTLHPAALMLGGRQRLVGGPLRYAGLYGPASSDLPMVAANVDPADANIRHLSPVRVAAILGIKPQDIIENPVTLARRSKAGLSQAGNAGHNLLLAALLALVAEALLARAFSRYQRADESRPAGTAGTATGATV